MMVLDRLHDLMREAEKKSSKARHAYKLHFDRSVRHTRQFSVNDMVYVDDQQEPKLLQGLTSAGEDASVKVRPKMSKSYQVVHATLHMVTIDIDGVHKIVAINLVTLSQAAQEVYQDASERNCNN